MGITPPPWLLPIVFALIVALLWPFIKKNVAAADARKVLKNAATIDQGDRSAAESEALETLADNPNGLVSFADEALRRGRKELARAALEKLQATGKLQDQARRLHNEIYGRKPIMVEAEIIAVTRFLDEGLLERADPRLRTALETWPDNSELIELMARLETLKSQKV